MYCCLPALCLPPYPLTPSPQSSTSGLSFLSSHLHSLITSIPPLTHLHPSSHSPPSLLTLSLLPPFPHSPSFPRSPPSLSPLPLIPFVPHFPPPYRALPGHERGAQSAHTLFWHFTGTSSNTHTHTHLTQMSRRKYTYFTARYCIILHYTALHFNFYTRIAHERAIECHTTL
jgi:hypothetical protein